MSASPDRWLPFIAGLAAALACTAPFPPETAGATDRSDPAARPREHAEESFRELSAYERHQAQAGAPPAGPATGVAQSPAAALPDDYLRGIGEGDLSKGRLACQRVSELAARTDLAKQIRVRVMEHAVDRLRERTGRQPEQDIEVVREEMVNELLRDVRIVEKRIDEAAGTCTSIAVMPRARITPEAATEPPDRSGQGPPLPH